jgi:hypothetical protein
VIQARTGFASVQHQDLEILTIILAGTLTHTDSMGNRRVLRGGEVQLLSAGTGVTYSETNETDLSLHLYQLWFLPRQKGLPPSYEQKDFGDQLLSNKLAAVASGVQLVGALRIHSDVTVYLASLEAGLRADFEPRGGAVFIYLTEGKVLINAEEISAGDQIRAADEKLLTMEAKEPSRFVLVDLL